MWLLLSGVAALLYDLVPGGTRRKSALIPADTDPRTMPRR